MDEPKDNTSSICTMLPACFYDLYQYNIKTKTTSWKSLNCSVGLERAVEEAASSPKNKNKKPYDTVDIEQL